MFLRNKQALFFTLFSPLLIMVIFGSIGFDKPTKFEVGVVASNLNEPTQQFVDQLKQVQIFTIHEGSKDDEIAALNKGDRAAVLEIPGDFVSTDSSMVTEPKRIQAYLNQSEQGQAQAVVSFLKQYFDKATLSILHAPTIFIVDQNWVNARDLKYFDFLLPGLLAMSIMQMSVFSVGFVFAQYKEKGVLKRMLATPMKPYQFVIANVITRLLVALAQSAIFISVGVLVFHAHVLGSYFLVLLSVILGSLMFLGLGFTISGLSKTVDSVPAIANLVVFPMLFLGGTFFAIDNMPLWLQHFAKYLPLTFLSGSIRDVMTNGAGFGVIKHDLLGMIVWSVILIGLATVTFSFQEKDNG